MKLITIEQWQIKYFEAESKPSELLVRRWLRDGKLPGRKVGGSWFIDQGAWLADGDDLVQSVLAG